MTDPSWVHGKLSEACHAQQGRNTKMQIKLVPAAVILALLAILVACETETGIAKEILDIEPEFRVTAAEIVAVTDAVTTISQAFAARVAAPLRLQLMAPPLAHLRLGVVMVWAHYRSSDPLLGWLRAVLSGVAADQASSSTSQ